ncbi:MAG TPA: biosynthetic-type acetolactate synthase large subunit [Pyrinomonadaceae bacterium]|nr:biosynthetic-type acetolactate synthase large subunit [Pyrinomonadaceae bacterium]
MTAKTATTLNDDTKAVTSYRTPRKGARILLEALVHEGVDTIFGYPGGAVLPIYDELARMPDQFRHILARHEQGAVHMAEGYAKATARVGVVLVTSGPGATNAVTGIANAFMDSTPLVVITGQVPRKMIGTDAFQEVDTVGITRPCTKYNYLVREVSELAEIVHEAFHLAGSGRPGPVVIDIPKDVTAELASLDSMGKSVRLPGYQPNKRATTEQVERAIQRILEAERPILYVGGGVIHANAADELLRLAEALEIPVTPTLMGLGCFPSGHPLSLGMLGMHGTYWANMAISEADLIIAIGVRFDDRVTGALDKFAPHAEIIHVDIDESSLSKNVRAHLPIRGDAKSVMHQMLTSLKGGYSPPLSVSSGVESAETNTKAVTRYCTPRRQWWQQIDEWKEFAPLSYENSNEVIKPQFLCQELHRLTNGEAIIATDVGQHQMWLAQFYGFKGPRQSITSGGLGAMGFGFPAALGAQLAFPDRQVIAFVGDGGFQMTAQELSTAVQYQTNTKIIVMNNNYLGMVRQWQEIFYEGTYSAVGMDGAPDFVKLAQAYGAIGLRASKPQELTQVLKEGLSMNGVVVMDIVVSAEENVYPMIPPGAGLKEIVLR